MQVRILGSGAGGGFPQWNCNCTNCHGVRGGTIRAKPRTQSSIAISADGERWVLVNASPDVRQQIESFEGLHPKRAPRDTPIAAIILTNADIDHIGGLLTLRESQPLMIHSTLGVRRAVLDHNAVFGVIRLGSEQSDWLPIPLGERRPILGLHGAPTGLELEAHAVPGKVPAYLIGRIPESEEDTILLRILDPARGRSLIYAPGIKSLGPELLELFSDAACLLFDGTCFSDDELARAGIAGKTARAMGHLPIGGPDGSLEALRALPGRKIYIHINNTNPILDEDSKERRQVEDAGFEIAFDGMALEI